SSGRASDPARVLARRDRDGSEPRLSARRVSERRAVHSLRGRERARRGNLSSSARAHPLDPRPSPAADRGPSRGGWRRDSHRVTPRYSGVLASVVTRTIDHSHSAYAYVPVSGKSGRHWSDGWW